MLSNNKKTQNSKAVTKAAIQSPKASALPKAKKNATKKKTAKKKPATRHKSYSKLKFLNFLHGTETFEIRIPNTSDNPTSSFRATKSGYFTDIKQAVEAVESAELCEPEGVYVTLNPVRDNLLARSKNKTKFPAKQTTGDSEIARRTMLLIDIDPDRPAGISASESEVASARGLAIKVRKFLSSQGWPAPLEAFSGNGRYLLYRIDLPNDEASKTLIRQLIVGLAEKFDNDKAKIDRAVFNASRLIKVIGTTARKGDEVGDRVHRKTYFLRPPNGKLKCVTVAKIEKLAAELNAGPGASQTLPSDDFPGSDASDLDYDRCHKYLSKMNDAIAGKGGHNQTFAYACVIARFGLSRGQAVGMISRINEEKCRPKWTEKELQHKLLDAYRDVADQHEVGKLRGANTAPENKPKLKSTSVNEVAKDFVAWLRDGEGLLHLRYWANQLVAWESGRYHVVGSEILESSLLRYLHDRFDETHVSLVNNILFNAKPLIELKQELPPPCFINFRDEAAVMKDLPINEIYVGPKRLVHIPSGQSIRNSPNYFSFLCNANDFVSESAPPKAWLRFLSQIFSDESSIRLLRQWMGYLLTADNSHQKIMMLTGPTRSGKSTISQVIEAMVGPDNYCSPSLKSLLGRFGLSPLIGMSVAAINDARLASGKKLDSLTECLLSISGNDLVMVEKKYQAPFSIRLSTRITIISNELPRLDDASGVIADRFLFLRTDKSYLNKEDRSLLTTLLAELPRIVGWAIDGWRDLHKNGRFIEPAYSSSQRSEMRKVASQVTAFVDSCCELCPDGIVVKQSLYARYESWCMSTGNSRFKLSRQKFDQDIQSAFQQEVKSCRIRKRGIMGRVDRPYAWKGLKQRPSTI